MVEEMKDKIGDLADKYLSLFNGYMQQKFERKLWEKHEVTLSSLQYPGAPVEFKQIGNGFETKVSLYYKGEFICSFVFDEFVEFDENRIPTGSFHPKFLEE